ncbi:MAG TPA: hypothetical protein VGI05_05565 [Streptosporangiaceae bacterium]|jgi:hypothetical protein
MLRRLTVVTALAAAMSIAAAITLATPALAKGPSQARITGPGLAHAIVVSGNGEPGQPGRLSAIAVQTGLFTVLFGANASVPPQRPQQLRTPPPKASLGPRYTIIYTVPGVTPQPGEQFGRIRQDLYPRAAGGPLLYTPPGQQGFGAPLAVTGWLRAGPRLPRTLAQLGVPPPAGTRAASQAHPVPAAHPVAAQQAGSRTLPWLIASAAAIAAAALAGTVLLLRHRKPATTHDTQPRTSGPAAGSA